MQPSTARIMLPPELKDSEYSAYVKLRVDKLLTREEAVREIRMKCSRRIVDEIAKL